MKYLLVLALMVSSCAHVPAIKNGVLTCAVNESMAAGDDLQKLASAILAGEEWRSGLAAMAKVHGEAFVTCMVATILYELQNQKSFSAVAGVKIAHGKDWIGTRPYQVK